MGQPKAICRSLELRRTTAIERGTGVGLNPTAAHGCCTLMLRLLKASSCSGCLLNSSTTRAGQPEDVNDSEPDSAEVWECNQWVGCPSRAQCTWVQVPQMTEAHAPDETHAVALQHMNRYHPTLQAHKKTMQTQTPRRSLKMSAPRGSRLRKT